MASKNEPRLVTSSESPRHDSSKAALSRSKGSHLSFKPKQKDSFPSRSSLMIQKVANKAPMVRWYSSSAVRPDETKSSPPSVSRQYSRSSGKAAVMSSKNALHVYSGSKIFAAAFLARFQSVFLPFINFFSTLASWSSLGVDSTFSNFGRSTRFVKTSSTDNTLLASQLPMSSPLITSPCIWSPAIEGTFSMELRIAERTFRSYPSVVFQHQCVTTTSSLPGLLASASRRAKVKSVPLGKPRRWHAPAWLFTT
mmetsp:Transcript_10322/g.27289  ORF Transcript_10322/g.27289 Transcript_10322/m.27289 type:complete len:253 (+) Transcript_10322:1542-2300(+)